MDIQAFLDDFMNTDDLHLLVKDVYELFRCPVMLVDVAFRALAWHAPADFRDVPFDSSAARGTLTYETSSLLAGDAGAHYVTLEDSPYRRRISPLVTGGAVTGYLILVDVEGRLKGADAHVLASVEAALAKQLTLETGRGGPALNTGEAVLQSLMEGRFEDEALFRLQADAAGLQHFDPQRLVMVNLELYHNANWSENALQNAILSVFPDSRPMLNGGALLFFINSAPDMELFRTLAKQFSLRLLVSEPMGGLFHLPQAHAAAQRIMDYLLPRTPHPFAAAAEDFHGLMLLRGLAEGGATPCEEVRRLAERDAEEQSPYCLTLYAYLCCRHSLQETSARLFTHRNTVLYRVRRMKEDFAIPLDDPDRQLSLLTSCAMVLLAQGRDELFLPKLEIAGKA